MERREPSERHRSNPGDGQGLCFFLPPDLRPGGAQPLGRGFPGHSKFPGGPFRGAAQKPAWGSGSGGLHPDYHPFGTKLHPSGAAGRAGGAALQRGVFPLHLGAVRAGHRADFGKWSLSPFFLGSGGPGPGSQQLLQWGAGGSLPLCHPLHREGRGEGDYRVGSLLKRKIRFLPGDHPPGGGGGGKRVSPGSCRRDGLGPGIPTGGGGAPGQSGDPEGAGSFGGSGLLWGPGAGAFWQDRFPNSPDRLPNGRGVPRPGILPAHLL